MTRMRFWVQRVRDISYGARVAVIVLALLAAGQLAYFSYENRQIAECQSKYNLAVSKVLKERAALNEQDRLSVVRLFQALLREPSQELRRKAAEDYVAEQQRLTEERAKTPFPELPQCDTGGIF